MKPRNSRLIAYAKILHGIVRPYSFVSSTSKFLVSGTISNCKSVEIGDYAEMSHTFCEESILKFVDLCGDNNPLHTDKDFAMNTKFGKPVVHGILASSLFSTIFGRTFKGAIYLEQSLRFRRPVYVNDRVRAMIRVLHSSRKQKGVILKCSTTCFDDVGNIMIDGEALVLLPPESSAVPNLA